MTGFRLPTTMLCAAGLLFGLAPATHSQIRNRRFQRPKPRSVQQRRTQKVQRGVAKRGIKHAVKLGVLAGNASRMKVRSLARSNPLTRTMNTSNGGPLQFSARVPYIVSGGQLNATYCEWSTAFNFVKTTNLRIKVHGQSSNVFLVDLLVQVTSATTLKIQGAGNPSPSFSLTPGTHHVVFVTPAEQIGPQSMGTDFNAVFTKSVKIKGVEVTRMTP